jgi:hypothetical protein
VTESAIEDFAAIILSRHNITKNGIAHGMIVEKRDIL